MQQENHPSFQTSISPLLAISMGANEVLSPVELMFIWTFSVCITLCYHSCSVGYKGTFLWAATDLIWDSDDPPTDMWWQVAWHSLFLLRKEYNGKLGRPSAKYHICCDVWMQMHWQTALCFPSTNWGSAPGWFKNPVCRKVTASALSMYFHADLYQSALCSKASQSMFQSRSLCVGKREVVYEHV